MGGFLTWFYAFISTMLDGMWMIVSNFFAGLVKIFNVSAYIEQFKSYTASFTLVDWILSVVSMILVFAVWILIFYMLVLYIRKYVRFRKTLVGQEDLLEELANVHREVIKLTEEKERVMGYKVSKYGISGQSINGVLGSEVTGTSSDGNESTENVQSVEANDDSKRFFRLSAVDTQYENYIAPDYSKDITLSEISNAFRNFACSKMQLYYEKKIINLMFAGLASTKLILLQGISGTGKTSLPYSMGKFFKNDATIASVQPSWRDRTELFGYFNEFTKKFNETEVLRRIYESSFNDNINIIVLDEMNIARVEYYFAEMLSILEMPDPNEWKLELVPSTWKSDPKHLADGKLSIPQNVWYVGTANNDDSTFTVSDKVYDRALVINLDSKGVEFEAPVTEPMDINYKYVEELYQKAIEEYPLKQEYIDNIAKLDMYVIQKFRIAFGNRIMKQLKIFVPVYVACGGDEKEAIDYIFATKVLRKFESLNLSLIRDEINGLIDYLDKMFGKGIMIECIAYLERLKKMY